MSFTELQQQFEQKEEANIITTIIQLLQKSSWESLYLYLFLKNMIKNNKIDKHKYYWMIQMIQYGKFKFFSFNNIQKCHGVESKYHWELELYYYLKKKNILEQHLPTVSKIMDYYFFGN